MAKGTLSPPDNRNQTNAQLVPPAVKADLFGLSIISPFFIFHTFLLSYHLENGARCWI